MQDVDDKFTVSNSDNDDLDIQEKDGMYSLPFQLDVTFFNKFWRTIFS